MKELRLSLGLSQAELAARAGLSRQQVSAVESGRNTPGVDAALALAGALGSSVEDLFGSGEPSGWEPILGAPPAPGAPVVAARVGDRAVYAPLPNKGASQLGWLPGDGVYRPEGIELFGDSVPEGVVVAGCDPILGLAAALLPDGGAARLLPVHATSVTAARALHRDRVHAAVVHGTPDRLATPTPRSRAEPVARWQIGLAASSGSDLDADAIAAGHVTIAHRPIGAEAERALRRFLSSGGRAVNVSGPVAEGHLEAAVLVVHGVADVALTMAPVADAFGLEFLAIEDHLVELRVDERWTDHPGIAALLDLFGSERLARRIGHLGGYELVRR